MATNDEAGPSTIKKESNDQEENLLKETNKLLFEIPNGNKKGERDLESQESLMSCYKPQIETEEVQTLVHNALDIINKIRKIRSANNKEYLQHQKKLAFLNLLRKIAAEPIPIWFPTNNEEPPPPLYGAIQPPPSYVAKKGDLVVAQLIQSKKIWIVAKTIAFKNGKYELQDFDANESSRNFKLMKKFVKPLPLMNADPLVNPKALFPCNSFVLAMYPQTTCFFKALVKVQPKINGDRYGVIFEDDNQAYTTLIFVEQRFIVPMFVNKNVAT